MLTISDLIAIISLCATFSVLDIRSVRATRQKITALRPNKTWRLFYN